MHERFLYEAATYENGKRVSSPMPFDTFAQAEKYLIGDPLPHWPKKKVTRVRWNEKVPPGVSGIVIEELRMRYEPGGPLSGTRVYA